MVYVVFVILLTIVLASTFRVAAEAARVGDYHAHSESLFQDIAWGSRRVKDLWLGKV